MAEAPDPGPITAEWKLGEVLARYPSAGPILSQSGRLYVARPGELYAQYPALTIGEWARVNGVALDGLLGRLNAEAETVQAARRAAPRRPPDEESPSLRRPSLTVGYTGSFRPREDEREGWVPVVAVQEARGPD
jgi:hypothetical protein